MGKKISQLDPHIAITTGDLMELSQSNAGTQVSTQTSLTDLVTHIANNSTFISQLTSNVTFTGNLNDDYVNVTGDTMTGALAFSNGTSSGSIDIDASGDIHIFPEGVNNILTLNSASASTGNTGQIIAGRFRYAMPIETENADAVLGSGGSGVATALVRCSNASPVTLTIRKNDSTPGLDFQAGNYFYVMQEGAGRVTLVGQTANVQLRVPTGFLAATKSQWSVIKATLYFLDGTDEYWVISGDMAV